MKKFKTLVSLTFVVLLAISAKAQYTDVDLQNAINAAAPGSTITLNTGTYVFGAVVNVNKAVTLKGNSTLFQVSGTGVRLDISADGAGIEDVLIEKTDKTGTQNIIEIHANNVTIKNNTIWGQFVIGDPEVSRAMVFWAGAYSGIQIEGNTIFNLRQPAYISGTHTGNIINNYVYNTKGWVVEGGNLTFSNNTWGINVYDIAILSLCPGAYYTDIVAMSNANNGAVIEDQRVSPAVLSVVYVDASTSHSSDLGGKYHPYSTITPAITRVVNGGKILVSVGMYPENLQINKQLTLLGAQSGIDGRGRVIGAPNPLVESIISPVAGAPIELMAGSSSSIIDGFSLLGNVAGTNGVIQTLTSTLSNVQLKNNHLKVTSTNGGGLWLNRGITDLTIDKNEMIGGSSTTQVIFMNGPQSFAGLFLTNNNILGTGGTYGLFVDGNRNVGTSATPRNPLIHGNLFQGLVAGINAGSRSLENAQILENTFNNNTTLGFQGGPKNCTFARNTFTGNGAYGLAFTAFGSTDPLRGAQGTIVQNNYFSGNGNSPGSSTVWGDIVISNQTAGTQSSNTFFNNSLNSTIAVFNNEPDAEIIKMSGNWFGTNSASGIVAKFTGPGTSFIDFTPYLNSGTDTDLLTLGFQGDFSNLWVTAIGSQYGTAGRIQEAVALVSGSTINVLAGTYVEPSQVVINKNVTMIGASKSTTFIKPGFNTASSGDGRGFFLVDPGFTFNLSKVTIDGTGQLVWQGIRHKGSGLIDDCIFKEIKYEPSGPSYNGVAIAAFGGLNIDITNCTFSEIGRVGVLYFGAGTTGNYSGNSYTGKGTGNWLDYGVEFGGGAVGTIDNCSFTQCKGVASVDGSTSAGILVSTYYGAGTSAIIKNSTITNNTEGIAVGFDASDASNVVAYSNNISNNTSFGISSTNPLVNAKNNWWGHASGPLDNKTLPGIPNYNNPTGLGNAVTSKVDYQPWNLFANYYNDPLNPYKLYLTSGPTVFDSLVYPNNAWPKPWGDNPVNDPGNGYPGDGGVDWGFLAGTDYYVVPEVGSYFGASTIVVEWDNTQYGYAGYTAGNIYGSGYFNTLLTTSGTITRLTIDGGLLNNANQTTAPGGYIAKISLTLLKTGYAPVNFYSYNFRYYDGLGGQGGVYFTDKNAKVKNYLGDVVQSTPHDSSTGDGKVDFHDLNSWTMSYWSGVPGYAPGLYYYKAKYDIGPTSTNTVYGMPTTDYKIQFEDLVIFAMSYGLSGNGVYPKVAPVPTEPVEVTVGKPIASGNETLVPIFLSGAVQDLRAASLSFSGSFGKLISAEKGDLLNSYTTPVMVMSRADGNNVFVDLSIVGADVKGLSEEGQLFVLRFEGKANVNVTSAELRNLANSPMLFKLNGNYKGIPTEFGLSQNYPNPFNPSTKISYQVPVAAMVQIAVFNSIGEKVGTLVNEVKEPGYYEVTWNASAMPSGVYFFRINAGEFTAVKKMMLTK